MLAVMIDGSNTFAACKAIDFQLDWRKLRDSYRERPLLRAYYFTALPPKEIESPQRKLADYLTYNGYDVVTKETREFRNEDGETKVKGNMDIEIAMACVRLVGRVSDIDLYTGDGDFVPLVKYLQDNGVRVHVYSTIESKPPMCADILRRQADSYVDLAGLTQGFERIREATVLPRRITFRRG